MTTDAFTWERDVTEGGAYRAGLDDLGGADMVNEDEAPDESSDFTAGKGNEWARQIAGMNRMIGSAGVSVRFSGGTPSVYSATGMGEHVIPGLFTVTDNGTGDVTLTWPDGALPVPILEPMVSLNGSLAGEAAAEYVAVSGVLRSVRVRTKVGAVAADAAFSVVIR